MDLMYENTVDKIVEVLKNKKSTVFCGAGISLNSGLPLANNILSEILTKLEIPLNEIDTILNSNMPFEYFIETIKQETDIDALLQIFEQGVPNNTHMLIAQLIKIGLLNTVMTTNFDTLIETALYEIGMLKNIHYKVYSSETEFELINWEDSIPKLIKIHGCISNKSAMSITLQQVATQTYCINKNEIIRSFFSNVTHGSVIVLGYSCSDLFDISPQIESIISNHSEVIFIDHTVTYDAQLVVEKLQDRMSKNPFKNFVGSYRYKINTDKLICSLWQKFMDTTYEFLKYSQTQWRINIHDWYCKAVDDKSIGQKFHLPARLFYNIGEFEHAIIYYKKGIKLAYELKNPHNVCSELGNLGMALNAVAKYNEARECLEKSIILCRTAGNIQGEVAQLQSLGNVYNSLGQYEDAEKTTMLAIDLCEKNSMKYSLGTSLGNLALAYNSSGQYLKAIDCLQRGLIISRELGNKQAEGSQLCSLGMAYFHIGDSSKAYEYVLDGLKVTKLIGDKRGECMALINISNLYMLDGKINLALDHLKIALIIAKQASITQSEAMAFYTIGIAYAYSDNLGLCIENLNSALNLFSQIYDTDHPHILSTKKALFAAQNRIPF